MDALIILTGVKAPDQAYLTALVAVIGSLAGNLVLFYLSRHGGRRFGRKTAEDEGRSGRFREWFNRYGLATVFVPAVVPLIPLPLKVFVITAGALRVPTAQFTLVIVAARAIHYFGVAWLAIQLGEGAGAFLRSHVWHIAGATLVLLLLIYLIARVTERRPAAE